MNRQLLIIKIGGSIITKKSENEAVFEKETVKKIFKQIKQAKEKNDFDLILIHGAGSFAHPLAKKYMLSKGYINKESTKGYTLTKEALAKLSNLILSELESENIKSEIIDSTNLITTNNGNIIDFNIQPVKESLKKGLTPILYGNLVPDKIQTFSIVSGDKQATYLAKNLHAKKLIFISDVDGVYEANPKINPRARHIPQITEDNFEEIILSMNQHNENDVTGEMKGKLESIHEDLKNIEVQIINGNKISSKTSFINNYKLGTKILF